MKEKVDNVNGEKERLAQLLEKQIGLTESVNEECCSVTKCVSKNSSEVTIAVSRDFSDVTMCVSKKCSEVSVALTKSSSATAENILDNHQGERDFVLGIMKTIHKKDDKKN